MVLIGMVIMGLGWVLFSRMNHLLVFYFAYLVIALGQGLGSWLALHTMLNNWFIKRRSMVMGLANSVSRLGSLFLVPLIAWLVDPDVTGRFGWSNTALVLGIVVVLLAFPITRIIRDRPEDYGLLPDGESPSEPVGKLGNLKDVTPVDTFDFTVSQALKTRAFWLIGIGHGFTSMVLLALMLHLAPMMTDMGYSLQTCLLYTSPSPRDATLSRMPSSA